MSKPPRLEYAISSSTVFAGQDGVVTLLIQNKNVTPTTGIDRIMVDFRPNVPLWESKDSPEVKVVDGTGWQIKETTIKPPGSIPVGASAQIEWRGKIAAQPGICTVRITQFPGEYSVDRQIYKSSQNSGLGQLTSSARYVDYGKSLSFNWGPIHLSQNYKLISLRLTQEVNGKEEDINPKSWDPFTNTNYPECFPENPRDIYLVKGLGSPLNYLLTAQVQENASTGTWNSVWYASCSVELNKIPHILSFNVSPNQVFLGSNTEVILDWEVRPDIDICNIRDKDNNQLISKDIKPNGEHKCTYRYIPKKTTSFVVDLIDAMGEIHSIDIDKVSPESWIQFCQRELKLVKIPVPNNDFKINFRKLSVIDQNLQSTIMISFDYYPGLLAGLIGEHGNFIWQHGMFLDSYIFIVPFSTNIYSIVAAEMHRSGVVFHFPHPPYSDAKNLTGTAFFGIDSAGFSHPIALVKIKHRFYCVTTDKIVVGDTAEIINGAVAWGSMHAVEYKPLGFSAVVACCIFDLKLLIVHRGGAEFIICDTKPSDTSLFFPYPPLYNFDPWSCEFFNFESKFNITDAITACATQGDKLYFSGGNFIFIIQYSQLKLVEKVPIPVKMRDIQICNNKLYALDIKGENIYSCDLGPIDHKKDDSKYHAASIGVTVLGKHELKSQSTIVNRSTSVNPHYYFGLLNGLRTSVNFGLLGSSTVGLLYKATALNSVAIVESSYLALTIAGLIVQSKWIKPVEDRPELTWKHGLILLVVAAAGAALLWSDFNNSGAGRRSQIGILLVAFSAFLTNLILNFSNQDFTGCNKKLPPPTPAHKDHGVVIEIPPIRKADEIEEAHFLTSSTEKERKYSISRNTPYTMIHESQPLLKKREAAKNFNLSNLSP